MFLSLKMLLYNWLLFSGSHLQMALLTSGTYLTTLTISDDLESYNASNNLYSVTATPSGQVGGTSLEDSKRKNTHEENRMQTESNLKHLSLTNNIYPNMLETMNFYIVELIESRREYVNLQWKTFNAVGYLNTKDFVMLLYWHRCTYPDCRYLKD